jgi:hypothetical protein
MDLPLIDRMLEHRVEREIDGFLRRVRGWVVVNDPEALRRMVIDGAIALRGHDHLLPARRDVLLHGAGLTMYPCDRAPAVVCSLIMDVLDLEAGPEGVWRRRKAPNRTASGHKRHGANK